MRVVVAGGTGLIGTRVVEQLSAVGHDVIAASRATGVNTYTGDGLAEALRGAEVVVDTTNSSYTDEAAALEFFYGSTLNLLSHGRAAGVGHHIALSVVGTDRLAESEGGYFAAKAQQEKLIRSSGSAFTIVHATQFFEFLRSIADDATTGGVVRLARALIQPMAADDVAAAIVSTVSTPPSGAIVEFAGPEQFRLEDLVRRQLLVGSDPREVVADPLARYFGTRLDERELLPDEGATLAATSFDEWLARR
jgi:uncharacterized protein YbjT (DUF2867 family)